MTSRHQRAPGQSERRSPWFVRKPHLLAEVRAALTEYPDLRLMETPVGVMIRGTFPVKHDGAVIDRFQVEIWFPSDYPDQVPLVREIGGRIPHTVESHVFPSHGVACLGVPEEWLLDPNRSFRQLLAGPFRNYFIGQALVARGEEWPFGERSHGLAGLFEAYGEMIGVNDRATIVRYLVCLAHPKVRGHWRCPCGNNIAIRNCCVNKLNTLRSRIPGFVAESALNRLKSTASNEGVILDGLNIKG